MEHMTYDEFLRQTVEKMQTELAVQSDDIILYPKGTKINDDTEVLRDANVVYVGRDAPDLLTDILIFKRYREACT